MVYSDSQLDENGHSDDVDEPGTGSETREVGTELRWFSRMTGFVLCWCVVAFFIWKIGFSDSVPKQKKRQPPPKKKFAAYNVPDFTLTECHGKTVCKADLLGKPWVVCFTFTRCMGREHCQAVERQMQVMQSLLTETDVKLVTITVDPDYDTPERLLKRAKQLKADAERWWFLTGDKGGISRLMRDGFKVSGAPDQSIKLITNGKGITHTQRVLHVDSAGRVVGSYFGHDDISMANLRRALQNDFRKRMKKKEKEKEENKKKTTVFSPQRHEEHKGKEEEKKNKKKEKN